MKRGYLKRKSALKSTKPKKDSKNEKRKKLEEEYGVKLTYWRYEGRKGIYWSLLSEYIRRRDFYRWGTCISCGKKFNTWKDSQAGHYAPAGNCGFGLVFDKDNIHAECPACNNPMFSPGKLIHYKNNLTSRYGAEFVSKIDERYRLKPFTKEWTQKEYDKEIRSLQEELKQLIQDNEGNRKHTTDSPEDTGSPG